MGNALLSGVLPFLYQQGDRAKRYARGLLEDPAGTAEQAAGGLLDAHRAQQGLLSQAFSDQRRPFKVTDSNALAQAAQAMLNGPLGMAPAGITAWHGSPYIFDKFDSGKIGSGEGAQAYGHGLYLAEAPDVAKQYQAVPNWGGAGMPAPFIGQSRSEYSRAAQDVLDMMRGKRLLGGRTTEPMSQEQAISTLIEKGRSNSKPDAWGQVADYAFLRGKNLHDFTGNLYKVDIPDSAVAKMLDWDKPLGQQAPEIQAAFAGRGYDVSGKHAGMSVDQAYNGLAATAAREAQKAGTWKFSDKTGARQGGVIAMDYGGASNRLRELGIPGIRYLDGGSRSAGGGTSNFVVFPGEENILSILERNGQTLR